MTVGITKIKRKLSKLTGSFAEESSGILLPKKSDASKGRGVVTSFDKVIVRVQAVLYQTGLDLEKVTGETKRSSKFPAW